MKKSLKYILPVLALFCLALVLSSNGCKREAEARKPNIVYILADDMGYGDLGCYGQQKIKTPHIDRLAAEGVRFTQHYAGSTVCAPSRDVLMTGLHTGNSYIRGNFAYHTEGNLPIPDESVTVAELLKNNGYTTGVIGKWGLGGPKSSGGPNNQGFDFSFCYLDQREAHEYYPTHLWKNEEKFPLPQNQNGQEGTYSHDLFTAEALKFIKDHKADPFFLYLPYTIPHGKFQVPDDAPYSGEDWKPEQKNYAAMITRMDRDVGSIMELLRELGLDDNTLVIFTSDNGGVRSMSGHFQCNGPLRGYKQDLYEGGIRVPFIAHWPGKIQPGTVSDHVSAFWDFLPTACELAGVTPPPSIDGISYLPTLLGKKQLTHDFLYWEYYTDNSRYKPGDKKPRTVFDQQALRMGDWKAVRRNLYTEPEADFELYDLRKDIGETSNVAAQHPEVIQKIQHYVKQNRREAPYFSSTVTNTQTP
ncbi:arylsulfatase [soil metagenome]